MKTTRAAIYTRISLADDDDTSGVDRQEVDCRALAEGNGWDVVEIFCDNSKSAFSGKRRPAYESLLAAARAGEFDVVIVWAADRLYRRIAELEGLVEDLRGIDVVPVKSGKIDLSTADGRMIARVLGSVAQHESEKKGERVSRAYQQRREQGRRGGGPQQFGYNADATAIVPREAEALSSAYAAIAAGASMHSVARDWQARGIVNTTGNPYPASHIRRMLLRPVYAGHSTYRGEVFANVSHAPRIVDPETFALVKAILEDPGRKTNGGRYATHLLTSLARCGVCGEPMRSNSHRGRAVYRCAAGHLTRPQAWLDDLVTGLVLAYLDQHRDAILHAMTKAADVAANPLGELADAERLRAQLAALSDLLAAGDLDAGDYAAATRKLRERLGVVEATIAASASRSPARELLIGEGTIAAKWAGLTVAARREIITETIGGVIVHRQPTKPPDPAYVEVIGAG